ncbi:unnamed protein product [Larinioides sclopetarius]|uniref:Uncharacterized protein n=1 Tax=Larinioides sclopetarius TaxID=280406 RepID=A0AAV2AUT0_9ARAC
MSFSPVDDFVQSLIKGLCRKFSFKEVGETTIADKLSVELLEFSRHFQDYVLAIIYKIPAPLITSKDLFATFLGSVCSDICSLEETVERRFFILCAFITNMTTLSFMMPCYRLIQDVEAVLKFQLKMKLSLSFDSDVKVVFENLEGKIFELTADRHWIRARLHQLRKFIQKAGDIRSLGLENQPDVATRLKTVYDMKTQKSTNDAESNEDEPCPYCESNCKDFLESFLSC